MRTRQSRRARQVAIQARVERAARPIPDAERGGGGPIRGCWGVLCFLRGYGGVAVKSCRTRAGVFWGVGGCAVDRAGVGGRGDGDDGGLHRGSVHAHRRRCSRGVREAVGQLEEGAGNPGHRPSRVRKSPGSRRDEIVVRYGPPTSDASVSNCRNGNRFRSASPSCQSDDLCDVPEGKPQRVFACPSRCVRNPRQLSSVDKQATISRSPVRRESISVDGVFGSRRS